ncbi:MAG: glycosyltransferase family 4 protein [Thermoleophilia bacterium]
MGAPHDMKVGILVPYSWSYRGGVIDHADQQARALQRLGIETRTIVGLDPPGPMTRMLHMRLGRDGRPPADIIPLGHTVVIPSNGSLANVIVNPAAHFRLRRILAKEDFDLLHLHEPCMPVPCMSAILAAKAPLVGTFHASGSLPLLKVCKPLYGSLIDRLDARIAVSPVARETAQRFFPGDYEIIPNGTPLPPGVDAGRRLNRIVFVGRYDHRKGLQVLLRAWPRISEATGARLRVIGADPVAVGKLQKRLSLPQGGVDLLGSVSNQVLTQELLSAKVLVAPSLGNESFGMVLTRAFGCATPVIASDIPGYRAIVKPEAGMLVASGDAGRLADAVIDFLADEPRRAACGANARELAQRYYSWEQIARRLAMLYDRLLRPSQQQQEFQNESAASAA